MGAAARKCSTMSLTRVGRVAKSAGSVVSTPHCLASSKSIAGSSAEKPLGGRVRRLAGWKRELSQVQYALGNPSFSLAAISPFRRERTDLPLISPDESASCVFRVRLTSLWSGLMR